MMDSFNETSLEGTNETVTQPGPTLEEILAGQAVQAEAQTQETLIPEPQVQTLETQQPTAETQPATPSQPDPLQQILAMQQQQQQLIGMLFNMMQQNQQPVALQSQPEIEQPVVEINIPEELPEDLQREIDDLYLENPAKALAKIAKWQQEQLIKAQREAEIKRQQAEMARRQQLQQEYAIGYAALAKEHGADVVEKLGPRIEQIMTKERPALLTLPPREGLAIAFELARREQNQQIDSQDPAVVLNQLLSQPEIKAKAKELIGNEIITEYLKGVHKGNTAPATIAAQPGTTVSVTPPNKLTTFEEAAAAMKQFFGS